MGFDLVVRVVLQVNTVFEVECCCMLLAAGALWRLWVTRMGAGGKERWLDACVEERVIVASQRCCAVIGCDSL